MPLWKISHNPSVFTSPSEKHALAQAITKFYTDVNLPDYYVNVKFQPIAADNYFVAGTGIADKVLVEIYHVARNWDRKDMGMATRMKNSFDEILKPYTLDKGLELEYAIFEGPAPLWRVNGIDPPEGLGEGREEEKAKNRKILDEWRVKKA